MLFLIKQKKGTISYYAETDAAGNLTKVGRKLYEPFIGKHYSNLKTRIERWGGKMDRLPCKRKSGDTRSGKYPRSKKP